MELRVTHAVRLRRRDVARLGDLQKRQLFLMLDPARAAANEDLEASLDEIEDGDEEDGDAKGLVYVRLEDARDPKTAFEGWFLDWGRHPMTEAKPDGGELFVAGTTTSTGVRMAQHALDALPDNALGPPLVEAVKVLEVAVKGAPMKSDPPFAHETAPKVPKAPKKKLPAAAPLSLEIVRARRWTEHELRTAPPDVKFQLLHAFNPKFATKTQDGMEGTFALGLLWSRFDPGPRVNDPGYFVPELRVGVAQVHLRDREQPQNVFDGWFMDETLSDAAYWPSTRFTPTTGRLFVGDGGITWTGVELAKGKPKVDVKKALPIAPALAAGLRVLGPTWSVEVPLVSELGGYFGSPHYRRATGGG